MAAVARASNQWPKKAGRLPRHDRRRHPQAKPAAGRSQAPSRACERDPPPAHPTAAMDDSEERGRAIVATLAAVVESMVHASERLLFQKTKFDAFRAPAISVRDYLLRIHKYAACSPECFVLALVYVDRLHQLQGLVLTELNVHRVLITSVVLAAKFFDDHYFNNAYYAKVGGVPGAEMNELELEFLLLLNFSLHVPNDTYARYYNELAAHYTFLAVRNASIPDAAFFHVRHYVVPDPRQDGVLVYVTKRYPRHPPAAPRAALNGYYDPRLGQPSSAASPAAAVSQPPTAASPAAATQPGAPSASTTGAAQPPCTKPARAAGQKRRSAVALGVNA